MKYKKLVWLLAFVFGVALTGLTINVQAAVKISHETRNIYVGKYGKLTVSGTDKIVEWSTSDATIVKVNQKGTIKGLKPGTATVTATVGKKKLTCEVTVKPRFYANKKSITVTGDEIIPVTIRLVGKTSDVTIEHSGGSRNIAVMNSTGEWYGNNNEYLKCYIRGIQSGTTTLKIRNTDNNDEIRIKVKVVEKEKDPEKALSDLVARVQEYGHKDPYGNYYLSRNFGGGKVIITVDPNTEDAIVQVQRELGDISWNLKDLAYEDEAIITADISGDYTAYINVSNGYNIGDEVDFWGLPYMKETVSITQSITMSAMFSTDVALRMVNLSLNDFGMSIDY